MPTKFYLRTTAAADLSTDTDRLLSTTAGTVQSTAAVNTTAGGSQIQFSTATLYSWWYQAAAVTISGTVTFNLYGIESNMANNTGFWVIVDRCDWQGAYISTIVSSIRGTELGTSMAVNNWTATPTSTTLLGGEWIRVRVYATNTGGTMAAATSGATMGYDGTVANLGDSWVQFNETITAGSDPVPPVAVISGAPSTIPPDTEFALDGSSSTVTSPATIVSYVWDVLSGQDVWIPSGASTDLLMGHPSRFVLMPANGDIMRHSRDATGWTQVDMAAQGGDGGAGDTQSYGRAVYARSLGYYYVCGFDNTTTAPGALIRSTSITSPTWSNVTHGIPYGTAGGWVDNIAWGETPGVLIINGGSSLGGYILRSSTDGTSFTTRISNNGNAFFNTGYANGLFWTSRGGLYTSVGGTSWSLRTTTGLTGTFATTWCGSQNVWATCASEAMATSSDGTTWTIVSGTYGPGTGYFAAALVWIESLGRLVLTNGTTVYTSDNMGVSWTQRFFANGGGSYMVWDPDLELLLTSGQSGAIVETSPDGVTWTQVPTSGLGPSDILRASWLDDGTVAHNA